MVDGGDATVRWGSYRYFLLFVCVKASCIIIYYLKDNGTRSYVAALNRLIVLCARAQRLWCENPIWRFLLYSSRSKCFWAPFWVTLVSSSKLHRCTCTDPMRAIKLRHVCTPNGARTPPSLPGPQRTPAHASGRRSRRSPVPSSALIGAFVVVRRRAPALSFSRATRDSGPRGGGQGSWLDATSVGEVYPFETRAAWRAARTQAGCTATNRHPACMFSLIYRMPRRTGRRMLFTPETFDRGLKQRQRLESPRGWG